MNRPTETERIEAMRPVHAWITDEGIAAFIAADPLTAWEYSYRTSGTRAQEFTIRDLPRSDNW